LEYKAFKFSQIISLHTIIPMRFQINTFNFSEVYYSLSNSSTIIDLNSDTKVLILGNQRLQNLIKDGSFSESQLIREYKYYLDFGLLIFFKKEIIEIYNDIYGAYPIFLNNNESITNYFEFTKNSVLNKIAVVEQIHFNHFLGSNTLCLNTNRIQGGHKIEITSSGISMEEVYSWRDFLSALSTEKLTNSPFNYLWESINQSINYSNKISLTLTGGYDSRLLFGVLLKNNVEFDSITWSKEESSQLYVARDVANEFGIKHKSLYLDDEFDRKIENYLDDIFSSESELPFITDVPPFLYLCDNLEKNQNLISGFMGSEIIRGPSYSSEVTLTKFAADIQLCENKEEIRQKILNFQNDYKVISDDFIKKELDFLVDNYSKYSKIGLDSSEKNSNIFNYLLREKYPKIFGHIIKLHQSKGINTINPYMDFKFILSALRHNSAIDNMTPYQNNWYRNFILYRYYAVLLKQNYPKLLRTKLDRGYKLNDLISIRGWMKLIPYQFYRKWKKKNVKPKIVVDSFNWFYERIKQLDIENNDLNQVIRMDFVRKFKKGESTFNAREKIIIQQILSMKYKTEFKILEQDSKF
jgi:hypothetical protein